MDQKLTRHMVVMLKLHPLQSGISLGIYLKQATKKRITHAEGSCCISNVGPKRCDVSCITLLCKASP